MGVYGTYMPRGGTCDFAKAVGGSALDTLCASLAKQSNALCPPDVSCYSSRGISTKSKNDFRCVICVGYRCDLPGIFVAQTLRIGGGLC